VLHCGMGRRIRKTVSGKTVLERSADVGTGYWRGSPTTHRLRFPLVFLPKYRRRVLDGAIAARVQELFEQASEVNDWQIHKISIQTDHVHLLLQIHPRESVASVIQRLKGGSSRILRAAYPDLEEFLWGICGARVSGVTAILSRAWGRPKKR
jgi:REP element-mobilizing transposase RayT